MTTKLDNLATTADIIKALDRQEKLITTHIAQLNQAVSIAVRHQHIINDMREQYVVLENRVILLENEMITGSKKNDNAGDG